MRVGSGWDCHKLVEGRPLILGGVNIPHNRGLLGHSDADVLVHAIIDSLCGAAALPDIGSHFPDTDERYRGCSSLVLLSHIAKELADSGYIIVNLDATVICEEPKLAPHTLAMRENIADTLGINLDQVSVKAKTSEQMGFCGRKEGIAVQAVALIDKTA